MNFEHLRQGLADDGFSIIESKYNQSLQPLIANLREEIESLSSIHKDVEDYPGGHLKIVRSDEIQLPAFRDTYNSYHQYCSKTIDSMGLGNYALDAMFRTVDTKASRHIAQSPHFDRIPTLKFMLYLNDVEVSNGAFQLSRGSHRWVKETFPRSRPAHSDPTYLEKSRCISPEYLNRLEPIEGKSGTIIVFDTDCVHHQGIVFNGACQILRSHYRRPSQQGRLFTLIKRFRQTGLSKLGQN